MIRDYVDTRTIGVIPETWYPGDSLVAFIADYTHVVRDISQQSRERHIVSLTVLVTMMFGAVQQWGFKKYREQVERRVKKATRFMIDVVQPASKASPIVDKRTLPMFVDNVYKLVGIERQEPGKMPCSIEVAKITWYADYTVMREYSKEVLYEDIYLNGRIITERRLSDGLLNVSMLLKQGGRDYKRYRSLADNRAYMDADQHASGKPLTRSYNERYGSIWGTASLAVHMADWCKSDGSNSLVGHALATFVNGSQPVVTVVSKPRIPTEEFYIDTIRDDDNEVVTMRRSLDGHGEAQMLLEYLGSRWGDYARKESSRSFLESLSIRLGVQGNQLFEVIMASEYSSIWAHADILDHIVASKNFDELEFIRERLAAPYPADCEVLTPIKDAKGSPVTLRRKSDGFVNLTMLAEISGNKDRAAFFMLRNKAFNASHAQEGKTSEVVCGSYGGIWVNVPIAEIFCDKYKIELSLPADVDSQRSEYTCDTIDEPSAIGGNSFAISEVEDGYVLNGVNIRKAEGPPPRVSVYDIMCAICHYDSRHVQTYYSRLCAHHPDVRTNCVAIKFSGQGQRATPCTDAKGLVMIMNLLSGANAAQFRLKAADVMVRYLGGDQTLISEIQRNAAVQGALPDDNIGRLFAEDVASTSSIIVPTGLQITATAGTLSIMPPDKPGVYFALVREPRNAKFEIRGVIPEGKYVIGFGFSAQSMKSRVEVQRAETGSYVALDSIVSKCAFTLEQYLKKVLKIQHNIQTVYGIVKNKTLTKRTEFFCASSEEYRDLFQHMVEKNAELEAEWDISVEVEVEKTKQKGYDAYIANANAAVEIAKAEIAARTAEAHARIAEAEVKKMELQLRLLELQR